MTPPSLLRLPVIQRRVEVLPQPLGPSSVKNSLSYTSRSVPSTTVRLPNRLVTFLRDRRTSRSVLLFSTAVPHVSHLHVRPRSSRQSACVHSRSAVTSHYKPFRPPIIFSGFMYFCMTMSRRSEGAKRKTEIALAISRKPLSISIYV